MGNIAGLIKIWILLKIWIHGKFVLRDGK
jgi:hypothetical protein